MTKWEAKLDHRCYPYFVPWTELEWLFKLLICMNCFCTPRILFHRWKIKIGMMQVPMMIHFQLMRKKRLVQQHLPYENNSIASENEETMVMRKMKALMFLRIWKMLTSLTRKLSQAPAQERNGSSHN